VALQVNRAFKPLLTTLLVLGAPAAFADGLSVSGRISGAVQEDSNPTRSFDSSASTAPSWTPALFTAGNLGLSYSGTQLSALVTYELGARQYLFSSVGAMGTLTQQLSAQGTYALGPLFYAGVNGLVRDRLSEAPQVDGQRPYALLQGMGELGLRPQRRMSLSLAAGAQRFVLFDSDPTIFGYSYSGPLARLTANYRPWTHHGFTATVGYEPRKYNAQATPVPGSAPGPGVQRQDTVIYIDAGYSYRGPFLARLGYEYLEQDSNSYQQTSRHHRFTGSVGIPLPWELTVLAQGCLQFASYPQGLDLNTVFLTSDEENTSFVSAGLSRPIAGELDADLRYSFYGSTFQSNGFSYHRHLVSAGVTYRF
jgi:hypothetical protein